MPHSDSTAAGEPESAEQGPTPETVQIEPGLAPRVRRIVFIVVGSAAAAALALLITAVWLGATGLGAVGLLVGRFDSLALAAVAAVTLLSAGVIALFALPADGWWLVLMIPVRIVAALAALLTFLVALLVCWDDSATALRVNGCETGYIVVEESFLFSVRGDVYRQDGVIVHRMQQTSGDDAFRPFANGAYVTERVGDSIHVWYSMHSDARFVSTDGEPALTLPVRPGHGC